MLTLAIACALGWLLAAFFAALWLGERGRRIDAQWVARIEKRTGATVLVPDTPEARATVHERVIEKASVGEPLSRSRLIKAAMEETGCSKAEAEAEADAMLGALASYGFGGGG